jgi:hypothetical protein
MSYSASSQSLNLCGSREAIHSKMHSSKQISVRPLGRAAFEGRRALISAVSDRIVCSFRWSIRRRSEVRWRLGDVSCVCVVVSRRCRHQWAPRGGLSVLTNLTGHVRLRISENPRLTCGSTYL